jgi:hypothetical protein
MEFDIFSITAKRAEPDNRLKLQLGLNQGENEASARVPYGKSSTVAGLQQMKP